MIDACHRGSVQRSVDVIGVPEDVFFSKLVPVKRLPTSQVAKSFSSEFRLCTTPPSYGFHKIWAYHHGEAVDRYFKQCVLCQDMLSG
jgi:hypothetical protein